MMRPAQQQGAALIIMFIVLILSLASWQLWAISSEQITLKRQQKTHAALAQAKQALLGYAISYDQTHLGQTPGLLPCPDISTNNGEGSSSPNCGSKNISQLGRFPWRTLEADMIKDGHAECLWYVVSGTFKNNPKTDLLNWDTNGLLQLSHNNDNDPIAALIISPAQKLSTQQRNTSNSSSFCGGNYQANNYLEGYELSNQANQISHFQQNTTNDQILSIQRSEIFSAISTRADFSNWIFALLQASDSCLSSLPSPVILNFDTNPISELLGNMFTSPFLETAHPPKTCLNDVQRNWQDQLFYSRCLDGSNCINIDSQSCKGLMIFAGQRSASQVRNNNTQRNQIENYLEPASLQLLSQANHPNLQLDQAFNTQQAHLDLIHCIL